MAGAYAPFLSEADDIIFLFDPSHPDFSPLRAARLVDLVFRVAGKGRGKNLIVALSNDAPIALVGADFAPADLLGVAGFCASIALLYAWMIRRMSKIGDRPSAIGHRQSSTIDDGRSPIDDRRT